MTGVSRGRAARSWLVVAAAAAACALVVLPATFGHTNGMYKDSSDYPANFPAVGCTACHGGGKFGASADSHIGWSIVDAEGKVPNAYAAKGVYTITVKLLNEQVPEAANHGGFNLMASAGTLSVPAGETHVQVDKDGKQATHADPKETSWTVTWTAPETGAVNFRVYVNDVDGSAAADPADNVYRADFGLADPTGAQLGAAVHVEAPEFGVSLQQYWIGLIGLAGMIFIMVAGFVYLKYGSSHNTDQKDR